MRVFFPGRNLGQMNGEGTPAPEPDGGAERNGSAAYLPVGIVFIGIAIVMMVLGTTAWIAFFTVGITFLILGTQQHAGKGEPPPSGTPQG